MKKRSNMFWELLFKCPQNINYIYNYILQGFSIFFLYCFFKNNNNSSYEIIILGFNAVSLTFSNYVFCLFFFLVNSYYLFSKDFLAAEFKKSPPKKWWTNSNFLLETYIQIILSILLIFNLLYVGDSV